MSFGAYISSIYTLLGIASLLVTCAFAWWKGAAPERLGTAMVAVSWLGADLVRGLSGQMVPTFILLGSDILISAGFLFIAIRYSSLWLGAAMILRAIGFAVHATQLSDSDAPRWHGWIVYLLINNVIAYLVLLTLVGGTLATILPSAGGWRVRRPRPRPRPPRRAAQSASAAAARSCALSHDSGGLSVRSRRPRASITIGAEA